MPPRSSIRCRFSADPLIDAALKSVESIQQQGDPECLHKLRVALRRMRSLWWAYEPLLDPHDAAFHRSEFKRVADAAGETRNWDVLRAILESNRPWPIAIDPLLLWIDEHRAGAVSHSREAIDEHDIKQMLHDALNGAMAKLTSGAPHPSLGNFARERVSAADKMLTKRWKQASKAQAEDYAALHQVRIAGKKVRYLLNSSCRSLASGFIVRSSDWNWCRRNSANSMTWSPAKR
jgi:CHAD domain-containing protein